MKKEYKDILNEINKIHMKRRILNIQEGLLNKKMAILDKN